MDLLVIRHAIAAERTPDATDEQDAARPLVRAGRRRFRLVVRGLASAGFLVDRVLHSPWTRAVETADLLKPIVAGKLRDARRATEHLAGPPRGELFAELAGLGAARVALVGHEPWLGQLVAMLTVGDTRTGDAWPFKKGGVALLDGDPVPGRMQLRAFLPPRLARRL